MPSRIAPAAATAPQTDRADHIAWLTHLSGMRKHIHAKFVAAPHPILRNGWDIRDGITERSMALFDNDRGAGPELVVLAHEAVVAVESVLREAVSSVRARVRQ